MAEPRRYLFAPLERRGVLAGLQTYQVAVLAASLVTAVGWLRFGNSPAAAAAAALTMLAGLTAAFVSAGGRPAAQWAPVLVRFGAGRVLRRGRSRPAPPGRPWHRTGTRGPGPLPVPSALGTLRCRELAGPPGTAPMAVITDRRTGTRSAVMRVRGRSFALLDAGDKERRLAAWGDVLTSLAREGGPVSRVQWLERTVGGDADSLTRSLERRRVLSPDAPAARSYAGLVAEAGPRSQDHECLVVVTVRRGLDTTVLFREVRLLEGQLSRAEVDVGGVLGLRELAAVIRTAYAPGERAVLARRMAVHPDLTGPTLGAAWPAATETAWAHLRTDACWHATYWVAEWPRTEVGPDFLGPLLMRASGHRSVSMVMAPTSPSRGFREAEAARTAVAADDELRRRAGFLGTARRRREAQGVARREDELSDGHAAYRFAGYVTVSAGDLATLDDACDEMVQTAHQCRLDVRRLYGIQDLAFTWTLPLARGLR